jgi:hypothetical protein
MKGCARTCLLQLLGWAILSYGYFYYFQSLGEPLDPIYWAAIGAGLFTMLSIGYAWGIKDLARERSMLIEAASGTQPDDGRWVAVTGRIHSMHSLTAPLSGEDVVAYEYKISRMERSGKSSSDVTYFEGKALVPSTIATRTGSIRLLSVPTFDVPAATFARYQDAVQRAREYIASTPFQTRQTPKDQRIGMEHESTDDDGNFRLDKSWFPDRDVDIDGCTLTEKHVKQNEQICAFGLYSQERGGIIPYPNWARQTRIMRGDAEDVAKQIRSRMIKYTIGIVFFAAAAYAVVRIYAANVK